MYRNAVELPPEHPTLSGHNRAVLRGSSQRHPRSKLTRQAASGRGAGSRLTSGGSSALLASPSAAAQLPNTGPAAPASFRSFPASHERFGLRGLLRAILREGWSAEVWPLSAQLRLLVVFVVAATFSWLGIILSHQSGGVATIWFSNGILFGLLITQPPRRWLPYFAAGLCADTIADTLYGDPFALALGVSLANSFEVVVSALLLTCLFGAPLNLAKRRPLVGFLLISVLGATAVTSLLGAAWTLRFADAGPLWQLARTWYLGDLLGMAILAPLLVILQRPSFFAILEPRRLPRTLAILAIPVAVTSLVFLDSQDPLLFFLFPALLLVAFRLGFPGTVITVVVVTLLVIGFTIRGHGPLMAIPGEHMLLHRIVIAQIFAAAAIFTMFPVAALLEEREGLRLALAASEQSYRDLAHRDELTGLLNRRGFNLQMEFAWHQALGAGEPVALLLLDADLFKQYNDVHGHQQGDECLRVIARVVAGAVAGTGGIAARFGGEEFAVVLPGASRETACQLAETIRQTTAARRLPHPATCSGVQTVSLGVAALTPVPGQPSAELVSLADAALYRAKVLGRDQVGCA